MHCLTWSVGLGRQIHRSHEDTIDKIIRTSSILHQIINTASCVVSSSVAFCVWSDVNNINKLVTTSQTVK